jgi:sugar phosphate isomerase/epimerase
MRAVPRAAYRTGTTSFVYPAGWAENVRRLAGRVQDVEILVFERPGPEGPSSAEIAEIRALGRAHGITFSVHAPLDLALASPDASRREESAAAVLRTAERTAPLAPHSLIVHVESAPGAPPPPAPERAAWRDRAGASLRALVDRGLPPGLLCVETLDGSFDHLSPLLEELGLSVALDVGHLARDGVPFDALLERHLPRTRVIQWHGTEPGGRDHRSLRHYPRAEAVRLLRRLERARWDGAITLEVFRADDLEESLEVLAELRREALGEGADE